MSTELILNPQGDLTERGIFEIRLNRPDRRNAVNASLAHAIREAWKEFEFDSHWKVGIVVGEGALAFSSGADLDDPPRDVPSMPGSSVRVTKPLIAAVEGWCLGLGMMLAMSCDLVVASEAATFGLPEVRIGATGGSLASIPTMLAPKIAMKMMLGFHVSGMEAGQVGLVTEVVPEGSAWERSLSLADEIAENCDIRTFRQLKMMIKRMQPQSIGDQIQGFQTLMNDVDGIETSGF